MYDFVAQNTAHLHVDCCVQIPIRMHFQSIFELSSRGKEREQTTAGGEDEDWLTLSKTQGAEK